MTFLETNDEINYTNILKTSNYPWYSFSNKFGINDTCGIIVPEDNVRCGRYILKHQHENKWRMIRVYPLIFKPDPSIELCNIVNEDVNKVKITINLINLSFHLDYYFVYGNIEDPTILISRILNEVTLLV